MRILFIVKMRAHYGDYDYDCDGDFDQDYGYIGRLGGLYLSAFYVVQMLNRLPGVHAKLVQVVDNNDIDREVHKFKPDITVIEALWVVPEKFTVLQKLHPNVKWVVRLHSEIPFLSLEGVAVKWISEYVLFKNVSLAANSERSTADIKRIIRQKYGDGVANNKVHYLPNWYPSDVRRQQISDPFYLNVGCFGAIRPLKNQLSQAIAAIDYADSIGRTMKFNVNTRCEQGGGNILRNLRALFKGTGHILVEHEWERPAQFLKTISRMDISMSVSFSETFNIVSADSVTAKIPLVASPEVTWASSLSYANPNLISDIQAKMRRVTGSMRGIIKQRNLAGLRNYDKQSVATWSRFLKNK